jgi:hypothetical protein
MAGSHNRRTTRATAVNPARRFSLGRPKRRVCADWRGSDARGSTRQIYPTRTLVAISPDSRDLLGSGHSPRAVVISRFSEARSSAPGTIWSAMTKAGVPGMLSALPSARLALSC